MITFKALHDLLAPDDILDLLIPYETLHIRSTGRGVVSLPQSELKSKGDFL